ncbi:MAG TPA: 3-isopropylmalate dehydrogenase [Polyangiaceae bacterium]|nr:3-isopropylmalate dehydrogenase [Polyangiaceae bacterium]
MSAPRSSGGPRSHRIVALPGDGIGPEVCREALRVLAFALKRRDTELRVVERPIGGAAIDASGRPFPEGTREACLTADAVLLGAVGGPKWDALPPEKRPEKGLLALRQTLGVYANLRPVRARTALLATSPLRAEIVQGTDLLIVRELLGDVYFGEPRGIEGRPRRAINTMVYTEDEIRRTAVVAFDVARTRRRQVTSVDKANVLETSRLWRDVVTEVARDYPDVDLRHALVDSCAMDLVRRPSSFDVVLTSNMFGDILSDEASVLAGSIGLLPSASIGSGPGLYEPIHGSAPDIAGQGIANPLGAIASAAEMLRRSLGQPELADKIDGAIDRVLDDGRRTADLGGAVSTEQMGGFVCQALEQLL